MMRNFLRKVSLILYHFLSMPLLLEKAKARRTIWLATVAGMRMKNPLKYAYVSMRKPLL